MLSCLHSVPARMCCSHTYTHTRALARAQPRIMDRVRKEYITNEEFTPQNAAKASSAAEGLCK